MAIQVPSAQDVTTKWTSRTPAAVGDYTRGVQNAGQAWQQGVDNAGPAYNAGVNAAIAAHSYEHNTQGKAAIYVDKSVRIGATRFAAGVQAGGGAFQAGIGKVLGVIGGITLPARGAVGSNMQRSQIVSDTLHQAKLNGTF